MKTTASHKTALIRKAREKFEGQEIHPCGGLGTLEECFSQIGDRLIFWFNTSGDNSTRMVQMIIS